MRLHDLISDGKVLIELPPEELAIAILRQLNDEAVNSPNHRRSKFPYFSYKNYSDLEFGKYIGLQEECEYAIAAAWQYLLSTGMLSPKPEGGSSGWYYLTARARAIKSQKDFENYRKASLYPRDSIHPEIRECTYDEFLRGDYESAVFKAFKCVEVKVRKRAGLPHDLVGVPLMRKAFDPESGSLSNRTEQEGERVALAHLFAGAIGRFKNPASHRDVDYDDTAEVVEAIGLASLLVRVTDQRGVIEG